MKFLTEKKGVQKLLLSSPLCYCITMSLSTCPLDVDVQNKLSTVGTDLENEIRAWVEEVTGEKFPDKNFGKSLKNGIILCKYVHYSESR